MNQQNDFPEEEVFNDQPDDVIKEEKADASVPSEENTKPKRDKAYKPKGKKPIYKRVWFWVLAVFLSIILILVTTTVVLIQVGRSKMLNIESMEINPGNAVSNVVVENDGLSVEYKGKKFAYNENMTAILFMGVDKESISETDQIGKNGQADALFLYAMDTETGKSTIIPIPRDTMADIDLYSESGAYVSQSKRQICLAYAYGDGKEKSCQNTVDAVSRLFYGLQINSYAAIDLKAVELLTEKIGGVTVTSNETFSFNGYNFYEGKEVKLKSGKQARVFIQERGEDLNSSLKRMERQKRFLTAFFNKALAQTREDITFPVEVYNSASSYTVTDIDVSKVSFLASCVVGGSGGLEYKSFKGEMKMGEEHAEYYADEQSVFDVIIDVFYKPVN